MRLTAAGFSEDQTEALFDVYGDGHEEVATKRDLEPLATKDDLTGFATREDLERFATKDDLTGFATSEQLQALELRLTLRLGGMVVAGVAVIAVLGRF